jgi:excisionase family DNA binding protein
MPVIATVTELEPLALAPAEAARYLSISKRSLSRLIAQRKIAARKHGPRTLVDVASLKAYYASLPKKTDHAPIVFGRRAHLLPRSRAEARYGVVRQ